MIASLLESCCSHEVLLCARRPVPSLTVESAGGPIAVHALIVTEPASAPAVDWVLVVTKAYDCASAAKWFPALRATGAPVAVLQNGVEHRERFADFVPPESIVPVIVDCPVERKSPTLVHQRGVMHLKAQDDALGAAFIGLFSGSAADALTVPDIRTAAWRKLCHNAVGILPTLLLQPQGVLRGEALTEAARQIAAETLAVAQAEGAQLDESVVQQVIDAYHAAAPDGINSMHADRIAGRAMELDARNGVIVRLGKKHGIPTHGNSQAVALLKAMTTA